MKKTLLLLLSAALITACGSDTVPFGGGQSEELLVVGQTDQPGVTYNDDITSISFTQTTQVGDSTYFEADLDIDDNSSVDLRFTLIKWSDLQVLLLRGRNGVEIPFSGNEFEILENEVVIPGLSLLQEGTQINSLVTNYGTTEDGFVTYTRANSVSSSSNMAIWTNTVYLPYQSVSGTFTGWVGINIISNSGVQIDGIGIDVIAYKVTN